MIIPSNISIATAKEHMQKGDFTSTELVQHYLDKAFKGSDLNAFIRLTPEFALSQAKKSDERIKDGTAGVIEGIPVAIKDLFCTNGIETTAGSAILKGFIPPYESTVTSLLYKNGGICIGKTNMDEFAMGSSNETSCYGPVINKWKDITKPEAKLVPGGSSGGSAAAVAADLSMGALGSDTGGSIRQPASFCGIVGMKPTYGRCSRYGMIAFASSLDQAGVLAHSVSDSALLLEAICGYDEKDSTSAEISTPHFINSVGLSIKGLRIGIPKEYFIDGMNPDVLKMWEDGQQWLLDAGAEIVTISLPHTKFSLPTYYVIAPAEASSNLARYDGMRYGMRADHTGDKNLHQVMAQTRGLGFGAEVKRRIMIGTYTLSAAAYGTYYIKAQQVRKLISNDFVEAFKNVDAILTPTSPFPAFPIGDKTSDPISMYLNDVFSVPASLAGIPAISVPATLTKKENLPLGLQILGRYYDEETVFRVAKIIEKAANFTGLRQLQSL